MATVQSRSMRTVITKMKRRLGMTCLVGMVATLAAPAIALAADAPKRPNIVIILADDMGYADMGSFGSEIKTPNLDGLAKNGVRFTNFYTHATCSPTRSMLLTGVDTHLNGLGNMDEWTAPNQTGVDGYEGHLRKELVTMPEALKAAGYHTYMVGKWHMGKEPDLIPRARGFPSQTLYLGRDRDNDSIKAAGARAGRQRPDEGVTGIAPVGRAA
jgi:arylsulfatase